MKYIPLPESKRALIDDADYDKLYCFDWKVKRNKGRYVESYYVYRCAPESRKVVYLHQDVMGDCPEGFEIDHKDGDGLNNTRDNLRFCTHQQNLMNKGPSTSPNKTSRFKGVHKEDRGSVRWRSQIRVNGKNIKLGDFETEEEAAKKYDSAAKHFFGEYARLNFPNSTPALFIDSVNRLEKTSQYRGVCWDNNTSKWECCIYYAGGKKKRLGRFSDEKEAALAYDKAAKEFHGKKAKLNFPD